MTAPALPPWLSVIMPTHGGERWIDATLRSLAAEADDGIELIVLDSSPTPATLDIVRSYGGRLRLRIVACADTRMWPAKTNLGVEAAAAEHVCWLHQDDLWLSGRAAAVRAWIGAAPGAALHLAPSAIIDQAGRTLGLWRCPLPANREIPSAMVTERLLVQNFVAAPAPVFRKDAWLACGGLDPDLWYTADWDIWLKLTAIGPVRHHDAVTTAFRIHGGSLTMSGSRERDDFAGQMRIVLERHLPGLGDRSGIVGRTGRASIAVNAALAAAAGGHFGALMHAACALLRLGPAGMHRYLRDSRIVDRVTPRLRAWLAGGL